MPRNWRVYLASVLIVSIGLVLFQTAGRSAGAYSIKRSFISSIAGVFRLDGEGYQLQGSAGLPVVGESSAAGSYSVTSGVAIETNPNSAPIITAIHAPVDPVNIDDPSALIASVEFSDSDAGDHHSITWNWGDGNSDTQPDEASPASQSHIYAVPGVYTLTIAVADNQGGSATGVYEYLVIYAPEGGFVTGGGWINSPAGAYRIDPSLSGKASFGFVSKYKKGASVPDGSTEFQFKAADLSFKSTAYQWLVVAGAKAQFKGQGTINGAGDYGFMLTAIDGKENSSGDRFRIKIWDRMTDQLIYDNQYGESDSSDLLTLLSGGSIVIHK